MKDPKEDIARIDKVVRFIDQNLDKNLVLENLAEVANYSPFHFQRIFKSVLGETPKQYIKRLRLEKAAHLIVLFPEKTILELAIETGFNSLEAFSRAFKEYYQVSPDNFRRKGEEEKLKILQHPDFNQNFMQDSDSFLPLSIEPEEFKKLELKVVSRPAIKLVYLQSTLDDLSKLPDTFKKIKQWVYARDLHTENTELIGLLRDYPIFTALDKCRYFVCASVKDSPELNGPVNYLELPAGKYATFLMTGGLPVLLKTCSYVFHYWLPQTGYKIVHEYAIQVPQFDPLEIPYDSNTYRIFIKVVPS